MRKQHNYKTRQLNFKETIKQLDYTLQKCHFSLKTKKSYRSSADFKDKQDMKINGMCNYI